MAAIFTVDYSEVSGWPKSEWDRGLFRAERQLRVAWSDRVTLLRELNTPMGVVYPYREGPFYVSGGVIFPLSTAKTAEVEPEGKRVMKDSDWEATTGHKIASYDFALITLGYTNEPLFWAILNGAAVKITENLFDFAIQDQVTIENLHWDDANGAPLDGPLQISTLGTEYVLTMDNLSAVPELALDLANTVNTGAAASYTLGVSFAAGTLLYRVPEVTRSIQWGDTEKFRVQYRLRWHPGGWNNHWRPSTSAYEPVYNAAGQYIQYQDGDFSGLFGLVPWEG